MAYDDNILWQTADELSERNLGLVANKSNSTQYVESGLGVTLNNDDTIDVAVGIAHLQHNDRGITVETDARTALSLPVASGMNHVYLVVDTATDVVTMETVDAAQSWSDPSLKLAEVDTSAGTVTEMNRAPDGTFDSLVFRDTA